MYGCSFQKQIQVITLCVQGRFTTEGSLLSFAHTLFTHFYLEAALYIHINLLAQSKVEQPLMIIFIIH